MRPQGKRRNSLLLLVILSILSSHALCETVEVNVEFPMAKLSVSSLNEYDQISFPGCYIASEVGAPALPQKSVYVSIPPDAKLEYVEVTGYTKEKLTGQFYVFPTQPFTPTSKYDASGFVGPDPAYYETDDPYPAEIVSETKSGYLSGYNIVGLAITPFEYRPLSKSLSLLVSVSLTLHLAPSQPSSLAVFHRGELVRQACEERVKRLVVNGDRVCSPASYPSPMATFDTAECVIVTGSSYVSEMEPLAEWMTKKGYRTEVHSVPSITGSYSGQDTQEKIRNFLKDCYSTKGIGWVILGGDTSVVPARIAYSFDVEGDGFTYDDYLQCDYYYSDLDGTWNDDGDDRWGEVTPDNIDMYADVLVGRLPFDTLSEASNVVEKTLTYEGVGSTQLPTDYQKKLLMFACQLDEATWGGDCKDVVESYAGIPGDYTVTKRYDRDSTSGKSNVIASINSGYNLINNAGHANYSLMSAKYTGTKEYLYRGDMDGLSNAPRYSILYSIGCWAAALDYDSMGEHFVNAPNGGGVAFLGNSRYGWFSPGYPGYGPSDAFDQEFFSSIFNHNTFELGEALSDSKQVFVSYSKASYSGSKYYRWVLYGLNLLGSPTTRVWTSTPAQMSASYDDSFEVEGSQFDVYVTSGGPLQSALVCLYKEDEVFETANTGSDGWAHITVSPSATSEGTMYVTVTKQNYLPHTGSVQVESEGNSSPVLSGGSVSPDAGPSDTNFTYTVHYYDYNEDVPATALVYVDGSPHTMTLSSGDAFNGDYEYQTSSLTQGNHNYYFFFEDGEGGDDRLPETSTDDGPYVDNTKPTSSCSCPDYSTHTASISFSSSDAGSGVSETKLYYKFESGSYSYSGESETGTSGSFSFTLPDGQGIYYFYTIATDNAGNSEDAPGTYDDQTFYDSSKPVSSCSSPTYGSSPIPVNFTASDSGGSGLSTTRLYYSFNGGGYTYSGDHQSGTSGAFSFDPSHGDGSYAFYTIAIDNAGNSEQAPGSPDSTTICDGGKPVSSCTVPTYTTSLPMAINFSASDSCSGIASVELYYSYNGGSYSYSGETESGTSGSFSFSPSEGEGSYSFYTIAYDSAGNEEDVPGSADDNTIYDGADPVSSCSSPTYAYSDPIQVSFTASDPGSGVDETRLYYRFESGGFTYSGLAESGTAGSFWFSPQNGAGTYDFYTIASDNAGNSEAAPGSPDDTTIYEPTDTTRPESSCKSTQYANSNQINVEVFASDDESGVEKTELYYSFNGGEYKHSGYTMQDCEFLPPPLHLVYVSPEGEPDAAGSVDDPLDFETVVRNDELAPGTLVLLREGRYNGNVLTPAGNALAQQGTADAPIIYAPYADERAIIEGDPEIMGKYVYLIGLENTGDYTLGEGTAGGIEHKSEEGGKLINCVIHDLPNVCSGVGDWSTGPGHELYGLLIYGIAPDEADPHGHAIYTQNEAVYGDKVIEQCIFHTLGRCSLQAYFSGNNGRTLSSYRVRDCFSFEPNLYFFIGCGGGGSTDDCTVERNYIFGEVRFGLYDNAVTNMTIQDNHFLDYTTMVKRAATNITFKRNTIVNLSSSAYARVRIFEGPDGAPQFSTWDWDDQYYYLNKWDYVDFLYDIWPGQTQRLTYSEWRSTCGGIDEHSTIMGTQVPEQNEIAVLVNKYNPRRANILVLNWLGYNTVEVDVSSVLSEGDYYRLRDVEDYFGEPVLQGIYDGNPLEIEMSGERRRCFILSGASFTPSEGEGTYSFYTIATDKSGNAELPPETPDVVTVFDPTAPISGCSCAGTAVNSSPVTVSFSAYDATSHVAATRLYYRFNGGSWTYSGLEEAGTSGSFHFPCNQGQGTYGFYTVSADNAGNSEAPPGSPDDTVIYDITRPSSSCSHSEYANSLPITIAFQSADDRSGVSSTKLYYSFNGSSFVYSGLQKSGTSGSFQFTAPQGQGVYNFYTIATDAASNSENVPSSADCAVIYDATVPSSSCSSPEYSSGGAVTVGYSAEDSGSSVAFCDLYYRFNGGQWHSSGLREYGSSGSFAFQPTSGDGSYQFYVVATDNAGNTEPAKSAEATTVRDTQSPSSSCGCESLTGEDSIQVSYSASDGLSGVALVKLYYRHGDGSWSYSGLSSSAQTGNLTFEFPHGDGTYGFYTIATDAAGNTESAPGQADASILLDQTPPNSSCSSPENAADPFQIDYQANDGQGSGVTSVELWFRFSYDQGQSWEPDWTFTGDSSDQASGSFSYEPSLGEGIYEFYTVAEDEASNGEGAPETADCVTSFVTEKPTSSASAPSAVNENPIPVSFQARDSSGIKEVELWLRYAASIGSEFTDWSDTALRSEATQGTLYVSPEAFYGEGVYAFYTIGIDSMDNREDPPSQGDCETVYDTTAPVSTMDSHDYASGATISSAFIADDTLSGVALVQLRYRYSADNGETFTPDWSDSEVFSEATQGVLAFAPEEGEGLYQFQVLATDLAGNPEDKGDESEQETLLDRTPPTATVSCAAFATELPLRLDFEATDGTIGSGVSLVSFWYRHDGGEWVETGLEGEGTLGTVWFAPEESSGSYEFFAVSKDYAGNLEELVFEAEATLVLDDQSPFSSAYCSQYSTSSSFDVDYYASCGESGVYSVSLYYRFSSDGGASWEQDWTYSGFTSHEASGTFDFVGEHGEGKYQFYTIATSNAGKSETTPSSADAWCVYDATEPSYELSSPNLTNAAPIDLAYDVADGAAGSGLQSIAVHFRFNGGDWRDSGLSSNQPNGSLPFTPTDGQGQYEFCAVVTDRAGNVTSGPFESKCSTVFDVTAPSSVLAAPSASSSSSVELGYTTSASEDLSQVSLFYRFSDDCGETWSTDWTDTGLTKSSTEGAFAYDLQQGQGLYQFRSVAEDLAGNTETKEVSDAQTVFDATPPASEIESPPRASSATITLNITSSDSGCSSGIEAVLVFYRFESGEWNESDVHAAGAEEAVQFAPVDGEGLYQFYTRAEDGAGNIEAPAGGAMAETILDFTAPESQCSVSAFAATSPLEVSYIATDATTEPMSAKLYYRFRQAGADWPAVWTYTGLHIDGSSGVFSFDPPHGQGIYQFCAVSSDECGNQEAIASERAAECVFDVDPPSSTIAAQQVSNSFPVQVTFESTDALSGLDSLEVFYCIDGGGFLTTGFSTSSTAGAFGFEGPEEQGVYTLFCSGIDRAGNVEPVGLDNTTSVHVDFSPPTSTASAPTFTNALPILVSASAFDGSLGTGIAQIDLYYRYDGGDWLFSGLSSTAEADSTFQFRPTEGDGIYEFFSIATDAAGNTEAAKTNSEAQTVLDRKRPDSFSHCAACFTTSTIKVSYIATTGTCDIAEVMLWFRHSNGLDWSNWESSGIFGQSSAGTISFPAISGDGLYQFYTLSRDECGNVELAPGEADCFTSVDTTPPLCQIDAPDYSSTGTIVVEFECVDGPVGSGPGEIEFWMRKTGGEWYALDDRAFGAHGAIGLPVTEGEGNYELEAVESDIAGNSAGPSGVPDHTFMLDQTYPVSLCSAPEFVRSAQVLVQVYSSDSLSGVRNVELFVKKQGEDWASTGLITEATHGSITVPLYGGQGRYEVRGVACDRAGNREPLAGEPGCPVTYDTAAPDSTCSASRYVNTSAVSINFEVTDEHSDIAEVTLWAAFENAPLLAIDAMSGASSGAFSYTFANGQGTYRFAVQAQDSAGNREGAPSGAEANVSYDTSPPQASCSAPPSANSSPINVHYNAMDTVAGLKEVTLFYKHDSSAWTATSLTATAGSGNLSFGPPDGDGEYRLSIVAEDRAGNKNTVGSQWAKTLYDTTAPEVSLSCPEATSTSPIPINYEANDALSGIYRVSLYYRFRTLKGTRADAWKYSNLYGASSSGSFSFIPPLGYGEYEFSAIATDTMGNGTELGSEALCMVRYESAIPTIAPSATSHNFGEVAKGSSRRWALDIFNAGGSMLRIDRLQVSGDFTHDATTPIELQPGATYGLGVSFMPQDYAERTGWLRIVSNDTNHPSFQIDLSGVGFEEGGTPDGRIILNQSWYSTGDYLQCQFEADYNGPSRAIDLYVCALLPDGTPLYCPTYSSMLCPFIASFPLSPGSGLDRTTVVELTLPCLPAGLYAFRAMFCEAGSLTELGEPTIETFLIDGPPSIELSLNGSSFSMGDIMTLNRTIHNDGLQKTVDMYLGVTLPDGSLLFYPSLSELPEPFAAYVVLREGQVLGPDEIVSIAVPSIPQGSYFWLAGLTPHGLFEVKSNIASCQWTFE